MAVTWADFDSYCARNPKVYPTFERFAIEAAKRGKRVGAKAIWERMRWELQMDTPGDDFAKLNNSFVSFMVRRFRDDHPGYGLIFHVRESAADNPSARRGPALPPPKKLAPPADRTGQGLIPGMV